MTDSFSASISESTSAETSSKSSSKKSSKDTLIPARAQQEKGLSAIDLECHIQAERITQALDKMLYRVKLAICLPIMIQKFVLVHILTRHDFEDVCCVYKQYEKTHSSSSLKNMAAIENIQSGDVSLKHDLSPELKIMLYILEKYPDLKPHTNKLIDKMKADYAMSLNTSNANKISKFRMRKAPPGLLYLLKLEEFREQMVVRMHITAAQDISDILHTKELEKRITEDLEQIQEYTKNLKEEKQESDDNLQKKRELIEELKRNVNTSYHRDILLRKKQTLDSERKMVMHTRVHLVKYMMLNEEAGESKLIYKKMLEDNMKREKQLQDRRRKVETQVLSWIQKYDIEMDSKQLDLDEITELYDEEFKTYTDLEIQLMEQNKVYDMLMAEKEAEYNAEMTAKLEQFTVEHAVRVLQYYWRQVLKNRNEKSNLIKLKRKQEAQRQAEARRAQIEAKKLALERKKAARLAKKAGMALAKQKNEQGQEEEQEEEEEDKEQE